MFVVVIFSVFSLTAVGVRGQNVNSSCIDCGCCLDGHCNVSNDSQTCDYGCADRHWGEHCTYDCGPGCNRCYITTGRCRECIGAQYGSYCDKTCPNNCVTCSSDTRCLACTDGFYRGWYKDLSGTHLFYDCRLQCQANCTKCSIFSYNCQVCKNGTYGSTCNLECSKGCTNNECVLSNGHCVCREGYTGSRCNICIAGYFGSSCDKICSVNCKTNVCDRTSGRCTTGCTSGFNGDTCLEEISRNVSCVTCGCCINGSCTSNDDDQTCDYGCTDGHWGEHCMYDCGQNCTKCAKTTGICSDCIFGQYESFCNNTCLANCATCSTSYSCLTCKNGTYGTSCSLQCSEGCTKNGCNKYNGNCECMEGLKGSRCDSCVDGYFGSSCDKICSTNCKNKVCDRTTGSCISGCNSGYNGHTCLEEASRNPSCATCGCCIDGICDADAQTCDHGCTDGHWGKHCMYDCGQNCTKCAKTTGICSDCIFGQYGSFCNNTCLANCATCSTSYSCLTCKNDTYGTSCSLQCSEGCTKNGCNKYNGSCECMEGLKGSRCDSCVDGYFGSSCDKVCSTNCKNNVCDRTNGVCNGICTNGYFGSSCDKVCSTNCKNKVCDRTTGSCISGCNSGYNGHTCLEEASRNPSCATCGCCIDGICDADAQTCDHGCTDGHWGEHCMYDCVPDCSKCLKTTGVCITCIAGRYGSSCNITCKLNCATCSSSTICSMCKDGFYSGRYKNIAGLQTFYDCRYECPINCTKCSSFQFGRCTECQTGTYGTTCSSICSQGCVNNICTQSNGYCECKDGFEGFRCDNCLSKIADDACVSAQTATKNNSNTAMYVLLGLTCLVIGLQISFAVVMFIRYQRKQNKRRSTDTVVKTEEMTETTPTDQQVHVNTNPPQSAYYICSQVVNDNPFHDSTMPVDHSSSSLHGGNTENHYDVPRNQKMESDSTMPVDHSSSSLHGGNTENHYDVPRNQKKESGYENITFTG